MTARTQPGALDHPPPDPRAPTSVARRRRKVPASALRACAALLLLPLLAGCASTPIGSGSRDAEVQQDLREIKQRLVEIQREGAMTRVQVEEMERRIATLEARAGIRSGSTRSPGATSTPRPPTGRDTRPPTRSGDPVREERSPQPIEPASAGVEGRDIVVEPPARTAPDRAPASESPEGGDTPATATPISAAAQAIYDRGYTLYHQGRYLDAEAAFQRFLQAHSGTDLADNAQYWIGEARYARGDVPGSLAAFREVVSRYPEGNKVPDALLKAGQSLERLGDQESARRSYQELLDSFPNSAAALVAEERLQALP